MIWRWPEQAPAAAPALGFEGRVTTYGALAAQARAMAALLAAQGVLPGDRVAFLGANHPAQIVLLVACARLRAMLLPLNWRLALPELGFILADAQDTHLFVDATLLKVAEGLIERLPPCLKTVVVLGTAADLPADSPLRTRCEVIDHESLLAGQPERFDWPDLDERAASSLCYTSGTTGDPKGVLYSHRSTLLHAMAVVQPDCFNIRAVDVVMPVVPMFHVNAWGMPYAAGIAGCSMVLPGSRLDPASLFQLIEEEGVTGSAGVPTIWTALLQWLRANPDKRFTTPPRFTVGGTALPKPISRF
jgi:fatty-acyl-CoA synthase